MQMLHPALIMERHFEGEGNVKQMLSETGLLVSLQNSFHQ